MGTKLLTMINNSLREVSARRTEVLFCIEVDPGSFNLRGVVLALNNFEKLLSSYRLRAMYNTINAEYIREALTNIAVNYSRNDYSYIEMVGFSKTAYFSNRAEYWHNFKIEMMSTARRLSRLYE